MTEIALEKLFRVEVEDSSDFGKEMALKELRETPKNVLIGLKQLKYLLENETNIPKDMPKNNERWLMNFLRFTQNQLKRSVLKLLRLNTSKYYDSTEYWKTGKVDKYELLRLEPDAQINGIVVNMDMKNVSFSQILQMTPNFAKMLTDYLCAYLPLPLKAYHIINNPAIAQPFIKLAIQLLNGKYRQRALIHGEDMREFHRHIAVDCLPECYGGCGKDVELESSELFDIANVYANDFTKFQECKHID
uniref:CRAL-TRIO domain-containing protein n=1 Tax=Glossina palpalis gambiensis TaxID=67801 RepID=A0A1B0BH19_9MUSC